MFVVVATKADDGAVQGGLITRLLLHDFDQRLAVVAFRLFLNAIKKISDISFHEMLPLFRIQLALLQAFPLHRLLCVLISASLRIEHES